MERIVEIALTADEQAAFDRSADAVARARGEAGRPDLRTAAVSARTAETSRPAPLGTIGR